MATVVAHRDGLAAKVDDLDQVRMAGPFTLVIVVAPTVQVATGSLDCMCMESNIGPALPEVVVSSCIEPLSVALDHRAKGQGLTTNGGASIG